MDANNQNNPSGGEDAGNNLEPVPVQPRQPQNLQGLLRFAIEARQETPDSSPDEIVPMDDERREFLAEALQNMVMDAVVILRQTIPILSDPEKIGSLANKEEITPEIKTAFESVCDIVEDLDVSNDFCKMGGFDIFPLCYNTPNPELWENTNTLLARVCQNFEPGQKLVVERGLLKKMLDLMREPDTKFIEKFVYAVSCCVRGNVPATEAFLELGGCEVLASLLGGGEFRLVIRVSCLLRHLIQEVSGAKERIIAVNLPKILVSHLEKPVVRDTEHLLHLLRACVDFPEIISQCRNPDLRLKRLLQKILNTPNVLIEPEQNREIIEYAKEVLAIVFVNEGMPVYDCEEEADR